MLNYIRETSLPEEVYLALKMEFFPTSAVHLVALLPSGWVDVTSPLRPGHTQFLRHTPHTH